MLCDCPNNFNTHVKCFTLQIRLIFPFKIFNVYIQKPAY